MKQIPTTHVTSLKLSRRLKELNVPQTSQFYWSETQIPNIDYVLRYEPDIRLVKGTMFASAYLASELGEMLPHKIEDQSNHPFGFQHLQVTTGSGYPWCVHYSNYDVDGHSECADTLAEAMGLMLAYLLENHLISVEELGK